LLDDLALNPPGSTPTMALLFGSPAIDQGSCPGFTADQRGAARPSDFPSIANVGDGCDIGAYEVEALAADFEGSPQSGVAPLAVTFTNLSSGDYDSCHWDFGDETTSDICDGPEHVYENTGLYTVTLTVTGTFGEDTTEKVDYIEIFQEPEADFEGSPLSGVALLLVSFTNLSSGEYDTCYWDFGDGNIVEDCYDPEHVYEITGTHSVSLTVSGAAGDDTIEKADYIVVLLGPEADFEGSPLSGTAPLTVTFTNLSTGEYDTCHWDFGDESTSDICADPDHVYENTGLYTVTLTVTGAFAEDTEEKADYIDLRDHSFLPLVLR
jgi:PKD repeat protein